MQSQVSFHERNSVNVNSVMPNSFHIPTARRLLALNSCLQWLNNYDKDFPKPRVPTSISNRYFNGPVKSWKYMYQLPLKDCLLLVIQNCHSGIPDTENVLHRSIQPIYHSTNLTLFSYGNITSAPSAVLSPSNPHTTAAISSSHHCCYLFGFLSNVESSPPVITFSPWSMIQSPLLTQRFKLVSTSISAHKGIVQWPCIGYTASWKNNALYSYHFNELMAT